RACPGMGRSDRSARQARVARRRAVSVVHIPGARSVELHRRPARHRHNAVESICRSRDHLADHQGTWLRRTGANSARSEVCIPNTDVFPIASTGAAAESIWRTRPAPAGGWTPGLADDLAYLLL